MQVFYIFSPSLPVWRIAHFLTFKTITVHCLVVSFLVERKGLSQQDFFLQLFSAANTKFKLKEEAESSLTSSAPRHTEYTDPEIGNSAPLECWRHFISSLRFHPGRPRSFPQGDWQWLIKDRLLVSGSHRTSAMCLSPTYITGVSRALVFLWALSTWGWQVENEELSGPPGVQRICSRVHPKCLLASTEIFLLFLPGTTVLLTAHS